MSNSVRIGILGDFNSEFRSHHATPDSLQHAARKLDLKLESEWIPTPSLTGPGADGGFDAHPSVVLKKGKNIPILLISWRSQREIARSLGWKSGLMIWGGPALTLLCLYGLLALTHVI